MAVIERRYARALLEIAVAKDGLEAFQSQLSYISGLRDSNGEFRRMLANPRIGKGTKKAICAELFAGRADDAIIGFLYVLIDKGRMEMLGGMAEQFARMADETRGILDVSIRSAFALDGDTAAAVGEKFRAMRGASGVKVSVTVDPSLLGGIIAEIGGTVYDSSLRTVLEDMRKAITA
ncbi:MAG: ATP synthase F1 subunit delta [Oscillospiraceae bacterium]|nr:ATP synthase F1 subunit delta [Oscillospiraceae bacterium]